MRVRICCGIRYTSLLAAVRAAATAATAATAAKLEKSHSKCWSRVS
jgi:hypothetical protein